jgi:16S rRNA (adenine1518-N6/adenine1519-N6)-dimethyltransferase
MSATLERMNDDVAPATGVPLPQRVGDWKAILRDLGVTPSRRMGQNFLVDRGVLAGILAAAGVTPGQTVLEVGPGLGILTAALAEAVGPAGRVVAVELDKRLAEYLHTAFASLPQVRIVQRDILRVAPETLFDDAPYVVVANLPYQVTSAAFRHFLEAAHPPARITVLIQREVAERIVAAPPEMSVLAVSVQFFARPRIVLGVPPEAFTPRPAVHSSVLTLEYVPPPLPRDRWAHFFAIVQAGFGAKRKQLHNSLVERLRLPREQVGAALDAAGIDGMRRAQTLSLAEWLALDRAFSGLDISLASAMGRRVGGGERNEAEA